MPIMLKPAESLPKNLTDEPMALMNLAASIDNDPIITFAIKIEQVKTRTEVEKFIKNFREYVEKALGIPYSKAMRAAGIYKKLVQLEISWSAFEGIGWTKVLALLDVVNKENIEEWVAKAKEMNVHSLKDFVKADKQKGKADAEQEPEPITTKTLKLHADQKQLFEAAVKKASEETGSDVEAVNLEAVFQNYLGGGLAFADEDQAMTYAAKHTSDPVVFVEKQVARLKQLFPQLNIAVEITLK